jgi:hypothetical protein
MRRSYSAFLGMTEDYRYFRAIAAAIVYSQHEGLERSSPRAYRSWRFDPEQLSQ